MLIAAAFTKKTHTASLAAAETCRTDDGAKEIESIVFIDRFIKNKNTSPTKNTVLERLFNMLLDCDNCREYEKKWHVFFLSKFRQILSIEDICR